MKYLLLVVSVILAFVVGFYYMFIGGIMDLYTMVVVEKAITMMGLAVGVGKIMFSGIVATAIIWLGFVIAGLNDE